MNNQSNQYIDNYNFFDFYNAYPTINSNNMNSYLGNMWNNGDRTTRNLMYLTDLQIKTYEQELGYLRENNLKNSESIISSIESQTQELKSIQQSSFEELTKTINNFGEEMYNVLFSISQQLEEIQWAITQSVNLQREQLDILKNPNRTQARELTRQGIILYNTESFEEAEQKFKEAYQFDATDYSTLMNLAYLSIHFGKLNEANENFQLAYKRSSDSKEKKAEVSWAIAKLLLVCNKNDDAYYWAKNAFQYDNHNNPKIKYKLAKYCVLGNDKNTALELIEEAIITEPTLIPNILTNPVFPLSFKKDIYTLLILTIEDFRKKCTDIADSIEKNITEKNVVNYSYKECLVYIQGLMMKMRSKKLSLVDYKGFIDKAGVSSQKMERLIQIPLELKKLDEIEKSKENIKNIKVQDKSDVNIFISLGSIILTGFIIIVSMNLLDLDANYPLQSLLKLFIQFFLTVGLVMFSLHIPEMIKDSRVKENNINKEKRNQLQKIINTEDNIKEKIKQYRDFIIET